VVNVSKTAQPVSVILQGMKGERNAETLTLSHNGMDDENTLDQPERIAPKAGSLKLDAGKGSTLLLDDIPPMSFRLYKVKK
jgi:alpha-L-arabinofuranosidase